MSTLARGHRFTASLQWGRRLTAWTVYARNVRQARAIAKADPQVTEWGPDAVLTVRQIGGGERLRPVPASRLSKPAPVAQSAVSAGRLRAARAWVAIALNERCAMNRRRAKVAARDILANLRHDRLAHA